MEEQKQIETPLDPLEANSARPEALTQEPLRQEAEASSDSSVTAPTSEAPAPAPFNEAEGEKSPELESQVESSDPIIAALQEQAASLKQQLEEQIQQTDTLKNRYLGIAAEFDNFRKRTLKEKEELEKQVKCKTISELLAVVDNFERARTQIKPNTDSEMEIHKSYQGVYRNLVDSLKRLGVSAMRPEGQPFDPNFHEAMLQEYTDDYPEGTVLEQLVRGYTLGDQVLRHAMVKVAAPKEPMISSEEEKMEEPGDINSTDS